VRVVSADAEIAPGAYFALQVEDWRCAVVSINRDYAQFLSSFHSDKFQELWPAQAYILDAYSNTFRSKPDVAIELPTGAGKTPIALLIAEAWRQETKKVAILSANKTLARQMLQESQALGIPAVLMEGRGIDIPGRDKRAYRRSTSVAIMNYWVYFNQNPVIDPADLVIMDDAHLAEHCLHSLYSVEIDRSSHDSLFKTLVTELHERFPEYSVLTDALADDVPRTLPPELLSFIDQVQVEDRFREIVDSSPALTADRDLGFRWRRLRDRLREANIYIGLHSIWMRPYIYPLMSNLHYEQAEQRLYMSATIGTPADLSRRLGVRNIEKIPIPPTYAEKTFGRRLIVMNRIQEKDIPERLEAAILAALRIHPKSVWLCFSGADAVRFRAVVSEWLKSTGLVGHPTWILTPLGDEIDEFKQSPKGHLFVAGRFDGMDFSADECRLVIVITVPRAINVQEEFISAYLRDSGFMKSRLNQRVIQALGRCNRSDEDFGVYVLADRRFATHFGRESNRASIPRNIVAEIDMAQDSAEIDEQDLVKQVEDFLRQEFRQYDAKLQSYIVNVPSESPLTPPPDTSADEVLGWTTLFHSQNYQIAANRFERCWEAAREANLIEIGALHGWHWAKALYLQSLLGEPSAHEKSLRVFEDAIKRGGRSSWFNRMRASLNRAKRAPELAQQAARDDYAAVLLRTFDDLLERLGTTGSRFERWCGSITANLRSESHAQYREGLEQLGRTLGYHASRPRHGAAADCRWRGVFGNTKEVVTFEAKIEQAPSQQIVASDIGQAHNQFTRAETEYGPQGYAVRGTIVTHLATIASDAEASAGSIKVLSKTAIFELWIRARTLLSLYRDGWSLDDISARSSSAATIRARLPATGWLVRALDADERFMTTERFLAEWSRE